MSSTLPGPNSAKGTPSGYVLPTSALASPVILPSTGTIDLSKKAMKPIVKECKYIQNDPPVYRVGVSRGEDILDWQGSVIGPHGTPYSGDVPFSDISFAAKYPTERPTTEFITVSPKSLQEDWSGVFGRTKVSAFPVTEVNIDVSSVCVGVQRRICSLSSAYDVAATIFNVSLTDI